MSDQEKPVTRKHFEEVNNRAIVATTKMHLELLSLEKALTDAGIITEEQLRQAREAIGREAQQESAKLLAMLQSLPKDPKGPVD